MKSDDIGCAVVTYNRKDSLLRSIRAILSQTSPPSLLVIIDNASTDGTYDLLKTESVLDIDSVQYIKLTSNVGCSAGFSTALKHLLKTRYKWFWLLDDDAIPAPSALEVLLSSITHGQNSAYCSAAIGLDPAEDKLCWPATLITPTGGKRLAFSRQELPSISETTLAPFLGLLVTRELVNTVGFPDADFFISGDDTEYSQRMRSIGAKIYIVSSSIVRHPMPQRRTICFFGMTVQILQHEPWKRYYEIRNRLFIARKYYKTKLWTHAIPGTLLRWFFTLFFQGNRLKQTKAFTLGIFDGLLGRSGMRWQPGK